MAATAGIIVGLGRAAAQRRQTKKAEAKQEQANQVQTAAEEIRATSERRKQVQQALIARAGIEATEAEGAGTTTASTGQVASVGTQAASNVSAIDTSVGVARTTADLRQGAASNLATARTVGQLTPVVQQGIKDVSDIFSTSPTQEDIF